MDTGKRSRSCTYTGTLFVPQGVEISIFSLYRQRFLRYGLIFKIVTFGHETSPLVPEVVLPFYPRGVKLSLFSLYGQLFPRYGPIFEITIFGHETSPLVKVPEVVHLYSLSTPGIKIEFIFTLWAAVSKIQDDF